MSNILNHNRNIFDFKLDLSNYWDFHICLDQYGVNGNANLNNSFQNTTVQALNSGNFSTGDQAAAAIEYLKTLELTDEELIALQAAQEEYNNTQTYSKDTYAMLNSMMQEHKITEEQFTALVEQNSQAIRDNSEAILSSATSLAELDGLAAQVAEASGGVVYGYAEALISLASVYLAGGLVKCCSFVILSVVSVSPSVNFGRFFSSFDIYSP